MKPILLAKAFLVMLLVAVGAQAASIGVSARKLIVVDKGVVAKRTLVYVARDPATTKGPGTDLDQISVQFNMAYENGRAAGGFTLPAGASDGTAGWLRNDDSVATYLNRLAPAGPTEAWMTLIQAGNLLKLTARGNGDSPFDVLGAGDPVGSVYASYCVTNNAANTCHCSEFQACTWTPIASGGGAKLVCKDGTPDSGCAALCQNLQPSPDPTTNYANIQGCLDRYGRARLTAGVYRVNNTITVPTAGQLLGASTTYPTIRKVGTHYNPLISVAGDNARVGFLTLDGNNAWGAEDWNRSLVAIRGSNNLIDNNIISNPDPLLLGSKSVGVYFNPSPNPGTSTANRVLKCDISNLFYGVIFGPATELNVNTVDQTTIHNNKCDGVTFIGYGRLYNSRLYENGYDCENGPIPGAAIYAEENSVGASVVGNVMYDNCGNNVDIVNSSKFHIENNAAYQPGYQWGGLRPYCSGAFSVQLVGVSNSIIRNNYITNNDRPWNKVSNNTNPSWFQRRGGTPYSDVPGGRDGVIALILAAFDEDVHLAINNIIEGNTMQSYCTGNCLGIGYFATRGTGYDNGRNWRPSFFTANNPFGSQVGSKRCGGNWYAGNSSCQDGSPAPAT